MIWKVQLFGGLATRNGQREVTRFRTQKAASLLAYLAYHPGPQPREALVAMLWPDAEPDTGRHNLSNALSFLRHTLEPPGVPPGSVVVADRFAVHLNPAAFETDVQAFETALRRAKRSDVSASERASASQAAADAYTGSLLPGYYDDWIGPESLRLESEFVRVVIQLAPSLVESGQAEAAVAYASRAVIADPFSEAAAH